MIATPLREFIQNISSIRHFLNITELLESKETDKHFFKSFVEFIKENSSLDIIQSNKDELSFTFDYLSHLRFDRIFEQKMIPKKREKLLLRSSVTNLIGAAEWFFAQLIHKRIELHPSCVQIDEYEIEFKKIKNLSTIKEVQDYIIRKKVENIIRKDFNSWLCFIKKISSGLGSKIEKNDFSEVNKVFQYRNVLIHNNGIINTILLSRLSDKQKKGLEVGKELKLKIEDVNEFITDIECCFLDIGIHAWIILEANNQNRVKELYQHALRYMNLELTRQARIIFNHILQDESSTNMFRTKSEFYLLLCDKKEKNDYWEKKAKEYDTSDKSEVFQLYRDILLGQELTKVKRTVNRLIRNKKISFIELSEEPIFSDLRDTEVFPEILKTLKTVEGRKTKKNLEKFTALIEENLKARKELGISKGSKVSKKKATKKKATKKKATKKKATKKKATKKKATKKKATKKKAT